MRENAADQLNIGIFDDSSVFASAEEYMFPASERGHRVTVASPSATRHNWMAVMSVKGTSAANTDFDDLSRITQGDGYGISNRQKFALSLYCELILTLCLPGLLSDSTRTDGRYCSPGTKL